MSQREESTSHDTLCPLTHTGSAKITQKCTFLAHVFFLAHVDHNVSEYKEEMLKWTHDSNIEQSFVVFTTPSTDTEAPNESQVLPSELNYLDHKKCLL